MKIYDCNGPHARTYVGQTADADEAVALLESCHHEPRAQCCGLEFTASNTPGFKWHGVTQHMEECEVEAVAQPQVIEPVPDEPIDADDDDGADTDDEATDAHDHRAGLPPAPAAR